MFSNYSSSDHFFKVQSVPLGVPGPIWTSFQLFRGREMVPKSIRFSSGGSKTRPAEPGRNEVAPMIALIPFLDVFGSALAGFGSRFWSCFFDSSAHDVLCPVWTAENITYIYGGQDYLQLRRNASNLVSRQVQFVKPNLASVAHLSGVLWL